MTSRYRSVVAATVIALATPAIAFGASQELAQLWAAAAKLRSNKPTTAAIAPVLQIASLTDALSPRSRHTALVAASKRWRSAGRIDPASLTLALALQAAAADMNDQTHVSLPGAVTAWSWLGPIAAGAGTAFSRRSARETSTKRQRRIAGRDGPIAWRERPRHWRGHVRFSDVIERPADAIVYAESWLRLPAAMVVDLALIASGQARLAVDGKPVASLAKPTAGDQPAGALPAFTIVGLHLSAGWHVLRVKLADTNGSPALQVVAARRDGRRLVLSNTSSPPHQANRSIGKVDKIEPINWLQPVVQAAQNGDAGATATLAAVRRHGWPVATGDAIASVLQASKFIEARLAWALSTEAPGDRVARLRQLVLPPGGPAATEALLATTRSLIDLERAADAHRTWQKLASEAVDPAAVSIRACAQRVDLWLQLGADTAAWLQARGCAKRWPKAPLALSVLARVAQARDALDIAEKAHLDLAELHPGSPRRFLEWLTLKTAVQAPRGAKLDRLVSAAKSNERRRRGLAIIARTLAAEGRLPAARRLLEQLPRWQWRSTTWALSSQIAARSGDRPRAIGDLRAAMRFAPGRTDYRQRLRLLVPAARFYQPYRENLVALARASLRSTASADRQPKPAAMRTAFLQTVLRHDGARQARYEAEILAIGPGGPTEHEVEIDYVPSQSQVEVLTAAVVTAKGHVRRRAQRSLDRVSEDWYGLYYDLERVTLRFADLRPGDRIVIEHVVRDFAADPFAMVFGEWLRLADTRPIDAQHIVIEIAENTPIQHVTWDPSHGERAAASLRKTGRRTDRDRVFDVWKLDVGPLPAVAVEANMPGASEVAHYLHISSFKDWAAVSRWYGGLVKQALASSHTDPAVKRLALKLAHGASNDDEKIRRVFHHVAHKIRYVGLEFGVHSLRPHDVSMVLARQFGDCKDKATLIVALLGHLGIEAEVALVRTSDNGLLTDPIASLSVFDHAIAWVPSRKLWLDATQQHHAVSELPSLDAGGMALRVPVQAIGATHRPKPTLVALPRAPGTANKRIENTTWVLDPKGAATASTSVELTGLPAVDVRTLLRDPATREEALQERLSRKWPGVDVASITALTGAAPPESTTRMAYRAQVPGVGKRSGRELTVMPFAPDEPLLGRITGKEKRAHDYVLAEAFDESRRVVIVPPAGFKVGHVPAGATIDKPFGRIELSFETSESGRVTAKLRMLVKRARITREDHAAWRLFITEVDRLLRAQVRWVEAPKEPAKTGGNAP